MQKLHLDQLPFNRWYLSHGGLMMVRRNSLESVDAFNLIFGVASFNRRFQDYNGFAFSAQEAKHPHLFFPTKSRIQMPKGFLITVV
jgi:hypothetical protein